MPLNIRDLKISATGFGNDERIPNQHSADGGNVIPELQISGVPEEAVELAVIMHDPDAPLPNGFTHWVVYGIDPSTRRLGESDEQRSYRQGPNSIGDHSYTGPQPPSGHGTHHYYFWVYALSTKVKGELTREEFLSTHTESIIEQNRVVGTFSS